MRVTGQPSGPDDGRQRRNRRDELNDTHPNRPTLPAISSAFHQGTEDAGFAVDTWRPHPFSQGAFGGAGEVLNNIYAGIDVDIAVRNNQAWIYRISYEVTLIGLLAYYPVIQ